ncbi:MAG: right-handed parallel beta-helix repeat-containing protein [Synergistaceae bacterium]|nr:right-handed parallel beta-helix repeat-containing protein [Synergistaceae bacterium]
MRKQVLDTKEKNTMKKPLTLALATVLSLALAACGSAAVPSAYSDDADYVYESADGWQITIPAAIKDSYEIETITEGCSVNVTYGGITAHCVSIVKVQSEEDLDFMDSVRTITVNGTEWAIGTETGVSYIPDEGFDSTESQEYQTYMENLETFSGFQRKIIESFQAAGSSSIETIIETIKVSSARDFLEALGSNRVIELSRGVYNLSEWDPDLAKNESEGPRFQEGISWQNEYVENEITLEGISGLTIRGEGASLVIDPEYAFVLSFKDCRDISIEGITAGYSKGGFCTGGVFFFADSSEISISDTGMYGSGTEGLKLRNVSGMKVTGSEIYECTYYIMTIEGGSGISFENCKFRDNKEYDQVNITYGSRGVSFSRCEFTRNEGKMFNVDSSSENVTVANSKFEGNSDGKIKSSPNVEFTDCEF